MKKDIPDENRLTVKEMVDNSYGLARTKGWWPDLPVSISAVENVKLKNIRILTDQSIGVDSAHVKFLLSIIDRQIQHINELKVLEKMMLVVTEVAEAVEEFRAGHAPSHEYTSTDKNGIEKPEGIPAELADVLIRIGDLAGRYGIDLEKAVRVKHEYNKTRSFRHGGKKA